MIRALIDEAETRKISNFDLAELVDLNKKSKKRVPFAISKSFILIYAHLFG